MTTVFEEYNGEDRKEVKAMTFREFLENYELKPGMRLILVVLIREGNIEIASSYETFLVGDCTPYIQPTTNDGSIGWCYNHPRMDKWVAEVDYVGGRTRPILDDDEDYDDDED